MNDLLKNIIPSITEVLSKFDISFAYIFGSYAKNKIRFGSDLDIAMYFTKEPDLYTIGDICLQLENVVNLRVDLVSFNNLYSTHPELAFNIISEGILLYSRDSSLLTLYKKNVFITYLDHKPMIDKFNQKFIERLNNNRFAE